MKKIDFKSMLIGFLLCTVFMLTIGANKTEEAGTYQIFTMGKGYYLMDTRSGQLYTSTGTIGTGIFSWKNFFINSIPCKYLNKLINYKG